MWHLFEVRENIQQTGLFLRLRQYTCVIIHLIQFLWGVFPGGGHRYQNTDNQNGSTYDKGKGQVQWHLSNHGLIADPQPVGQDIRQPGTYDRPNPYEDRLNTESQGALIGR